MDYIHEGFPYGAQHPHQHQPVFYPPTGYAHFHGHQHHHHQQQQQIEEFYNHYPHVEYSDYMPYQEEFDEVGEVSTRPRLTKEQAETLEQHFQANHKPNSMVKRQLAMQTKLTLPRVANWFQNRRAKAKQQRKQEEYENNQSHEHDNGQDDDAEEEYDMQTHLELANIPSRHEEHARSDQPPIAEPCATGTELKTSKEASWASLQRTIKQAELAKQQQQAYEQVQMQRSTSHQQKEVPQPHPSSIPIPHSSFEPTSEQWTGKHSLLDPWSPTHAFQDTTFDFGFDESDAIGMCKEELTEAPTVMSFPQQLETSVEPWHDSLPTPKGIPADSMKAHFLQSPEMPPPHYPDSRRGSAAESLTAGFGTFALATGSPQNLANSMQSQTDMTQQSEGPMDIAARRKRPRPAALTSAALRSRSYGALTSVSPTVRPGMTPGAHTVRHVKSTGHSLNARFGGIRKASSAQRSPINISTFAEAEALNRLMAQQAAAAAQSYEGGLHTGGLTPVGTPGLVVNTQVQPEDAHGYLAQKLELATRYQLPNTQHFTLATASPPITPFSADFAQHHQHHMSVPPVSAPPQYATFPDYTPPYSAGPLTNSSWSDAPLTSPEMPNFPPVMYIPALHGSHKMESPQSHFQQFVLPSDNKMDMHQALHMPEQKRTEFCIQEFPNQKEEHAHIASQMAPNKPKNFVFANSAASDYDQT